MLSPELLKKVRQIEITTRKVVTDVMSGQYRSHFKGHGVVFSEHRQYVAGDDVRHIDWKVSARSRDLVIKKYEEERELTVFLVVDVSASEGFGSKEKLKSEIAAEVGAMLAFAAVHAGDRVGVLLFAGEVEKIIPPKKGRSHILRITQEILTHKNRTSGTNLGAALDAAGRIMKHSGVVFVISDFIAQNYALPLKRLARRHDVVAIRVSDPREHQLPALGQVLLFNPETGQEQLVDTSSYLFKTWFKEYLDSQAAQDQSVFRNGAVETVEINTAADYGDAIVKFFKARSRRRK